MSKEIKFKDLKDGMIISCFHNSLIKTVILKGMVFTSSKYPDKTFVAHNGDDGGWSYCRDGKEVEAPDGYMSVWCIGDGNGDNVTNLISHGE